MEGTPRPENLPREVIPDITTPEKSTAESSPSMNGGVDKHHQNEPPASPPATPAPAAWDKYAVYPALAATLSSTDITLLRLNRLLSTSSGLETILSTTDYTASTLHHLLSSKTLLPLLTRLNLRSPASQKSKASSNSNALTPLLTLSSLISEARTTLRLFGLLPLWSWGSSTIRSPPQDPFLRSLALLQVFINVIYQAMENIAFLAEKGIISKKWVEKWGLGGVGRWYIWSTRAWLGHVLLEFVRLGRERSLRLQRQQDREEEEGEKIGREELRVAKEKEVLSWKKALVGNLCWAPLCVHWSLEEGVGVPEEITGFISLLAGLWDLRDSWRMTAL